MTVDSRILRLSVPTPFAIGRVNVYAVRGPKGFYLIDAGIVTEEGRALIKEWLPHPLTGILLTHAHMDHLGLAREIAQEEKCPVYVHPGEFQRLKVFEEQVAMMKRLMALGGVPRELVELAMTSYQQSRPGFVEPLSGVEALDLVSGQVFDTEIGSLQVVHTPGHAQGHCCFYCKEQRVLFSGDHILQKVVSNPLLEEDWQGRRRRSYENYLASMERVSHLEVEQVYPGHGKPFSEIGEVVQNFHKYHDSRAQRVLERLSVQPQTPWQVASQLYPEAKGADVFFVLSKVWGHLDVLEGDERIRIRKHGEVTGYYRG